MYEIERPPLLAWAPPGPSPRLEPPAIYMCMPPAIYNMYYYLQCCTCPHYDAAYIGVRRTFATPRVSVTTLNIMSE